MADAHRDDSPLDEATADAAAPTSAPAPVQRKKGLRVGLARLVVYMAVAALATYVVMDQLRAQSYGDELVPWQAGWSHAETYIAQGGGDRPILLQFTADWCGPCQHMKKTTFADEHVASQLEQEWVPVKIDLTDQSDREAGAVAQAFNVVGIPTYIALSPTGEPIDQLTGSSDAEAFTNWLDQAQSKMANTNGAPVSAR